jgi:uncharacterized membrane protein
VPSLVQGTIRRLLRDMRRWSDGLVRALGFVLVAVSLAMFYRALVAVDRREFVACSLAAVVGWLTLGAGVEFIRPESAE